MLGISFLYIIGYVTADQCLQGTQQKARKTASDRNKQLEREQQQI